MARGDPPMPLESLLPYYRGARYSALALRGRHRDCEGLREDAQRYVAMVDQYSEAARATFKLQKEKGTVESGA